MIELFTGRRHDDERAKRWASFVAVITNADLLAAIALSLIGLLLALNLILCFLEFGAVIEQYNQF